MSVGSILGGAGGMAGTADAIGQMQSSLAQQSMLSAETQHATLVSAQLSAEQSMAKAMANTLTAGANQISQSAGQSH